MSFKNLTIPTLLTLALVFSAIIGCQNSSSTEEQTDTEETEESMESSEPESVPEMTSDSASVSYSDAEIEEFVEALKAVQTVQQEAQQEMMKVIEDNGITVQRYQELGQALSKGETPEQTAEEQKAMTDINSEFSEIQAGQEAKLNAAVEETGMKIETYMAMIQNIQQDMQLQQRIQQMLMAEEQASGN